jgi:hypothetical protein
MPSGVVQARIWDNGKTYPLHTFKAGTIYLIDAAQFQGHWYYVAGSDTTDKISLYQDPLSGLKDPATARAIPVLSFRSLGATKVSFSTNARFITVQAAQKFGVYDMETQERYQYSLKLPLDGPLHWMDGHRLIGTSGGSLLVMDYDGTNQQMLAPSADINGGYSSRDFNQLFVVAPIAAGDPAVIFQAVDLRAGTDLPK